MGNVIEQHGVAVKQTFCDFSSRHLYTVVQDDGVSGEDRLMLATVCRRPELRPLLRNVRFRIDDLESVAFRVLGDDLIVINRQILSTPVPAAFHLRHALEIITLYRILPDTFESSPAIVVSLAAFVMALNYLEGMILQEKDVVQASLPKWMVRASDDILRKSGSNSAETIFTVLGDDIHRLLEYQGWDDANTQVEDAASHIPEVLASVNRLLPFTSPTEQILTAGGDQRLAVDRETGLNCYGCSPRPRPWAITFSSCTSSSISEHAFQEAEWLRQELLAEALAGNLWDYCATTLKQVREDITELLNLNQVTDTRVILTASGTDGEFIALYFAMLGSDAPIRNIVISSKEIGSGTVHAAGGRHFDTLTPLCKTVVVGMPLEGFPHEHINVSTVELRNSDGQLLSADELNHMVEHLVDEALANGERVLIHLLDCSKTGIGGPQVSTVRELARRDPAKISVMVDAAQMRVGPDGLRSYLENGFMVLITGSKFFTAPPFAGALLVPPSLVDAIGNKDQFPAGLADYITKQDLPQEWQHFGKNLRDECSIPLLLRWKAALWEMKAFYSVPAINQFNTINTFGQSILKMIDNNPDLELVMAPLHDREFPGAGISWDQLPTIFTFLVYHRDGSNRGRPLTYEEARFAYRCINTDIARFLPVQASDRELEIARKHCHIAQPVRILEENSEWIGGLRIAAGARLVSGVEFDDALGESPHDRLSAEIRSSGVIMSKLSIIVRYWDVLTGFDLRTGATPQAGYYQF